MKSHTMAELRLGPIALIQHVDTNPPPGDVFDFSQLSPTQTFTAPQVEETEQQVIAQEEQEQQQQYWQLLPGQVPPPTPGGPS